MYETFSKEYERLQNLSQDWLITSWSQNNELDRLLCKIYYLKARKERLSLVRKFHRVTSKEIFKNGKTKIK